MVVSKVVDFFWPNFWWKVLFDKGRRSGGVALLKNFTNRKGAKFVALQEWTEKCCRNVEIWAE
jgi:hypothetical protein